MIFGAKTLIGRLDTFEKDGRPVDEQLWLHEGDYATFEDKFGRRWKLVPNTNEKIIMPFIIQPLPKE